MSKSSKTRQSEFRKKAKRAEKERQRALYTSFKQAGTNTKSKRNKLKSARTAKVNVKSHSTGRCFNHGCVACSSNLNDPWLALPGSCIYSKRFTSSKWRNE